MNRTLVLASTSPYRRRLLEQLGLPFTVAAPDYVEEHDLPLVPDELVVELATRKARSLAARCPDAILIASDQVAEVEGRVLTKPGHSEAAVQQLLALQGRAHRLLTALVLLDTASGELASVLDVHHLRMRAVSEAQVRAYVAREQPLDCAGAYKIEGPGIALFESMRGEDYTGIIGLPLTKLAAMLARLGVDPLSAT